MHIRARRDVMVDNRGLVRSGLQGKGCASYSEEDENVRGAGADLICLLVLLLYLPLDFLLECVLDEILTVS